jgi:cytoskeletal protein CcmA (bactofilin family)
MSFFGGRRKSEPETPDLSAEEDLPVIPPPHHTKGFDTVLGPGSSIEGTLQSDGNLRLDGQFTGTLEITGNVLVGEAADINADLNARHISIAGTVRGNVIGHKIQLLRTARVWGDITAQTLTTEEGALIEGKVSMKHQEREISAVWEDQDDDQVVAVEAEPPTDPITTAEEDEEDAETYLSPDQTEDTQNAETPEDPERHA